MQNCGKFKQLKKHVNRERFFVFLTRCACAGKAFQTIKKTREGDEALGGSSHFAPAAQAADVNSYKGQNVRSDDI